jgi:hypothetical protein
LYFLNQAWYFLNQACNCFQPSSAACEDVAVVVTFARLIPPKKTRPPAEYDAYAALSCPDIEIG